MLTRTLTHKYFRPSPSAAPFTKEQLDQIGAFETQAAACTFHKCDACRKVKLSMTTKDVNGIMLCKECKDNKRKVDDFSHPTWTDSSGMIRFDIPEVLLDLREGEKLLIQQVSPYVPLHHLQQGSYGSRGHVCSFPQDISHVCNVLPRIPSEVSVVKVVKEFTDKSNERQRLTFRIR